MWPDSSSWHVLVMITWPRTWLRSRGIRIVDVGEKREDQSSSGSGKRQKTFSSHKFQDQGQDGVVSQAWQTICYFCR